MKTQRPVSDCVIHVVRTFHASPEKLYDALTIADIARKWWVTAPWEFTELVMEPHPGGRFVYAIASSEDASKYKTYGEYLLAERPRRIVWTNAEGGGTIVSVDLDEVPDGVRATIVQGAYETPKEAQMHCAGWNACLDNLEKTLGE